MAEGFIGSLDSVFHFNIVARRCCSSGGGSSVPGRAPVTLAAGRKLRVRWDEGVFLERLLSGRRHSAVAGEIAGLLTQPQGSRGGCSLCSRKRERPSTACCTACRLCALVRWGRLPLERTVSALVVVGVNEPSSGLFPDGRRVSPHVLSNLVQRGCGVAPGRGRCSSWHRGPL